MDTASRKSKGKKDLRALTLIAVEPPLRRTSASPSAPRLRLLWHLQVISPQGFAMLFYDMSLFVSDPSLVSAGTDPGGGVVSCFDSLVFRCRGQ